MKPFDLQAALAGAKVVTRDGREVKIAGYNPDAIEANRVFFWDADNIPRVAYEDGRVGSIVLDDLFMAPTERKEWIVRCYYDLQKTDPYFAGPFKTLFEAQRLADCRVLGLATIHEIIIHE